MHRGVIGCPPSLRLPAVAATLAEHHVHCAVVAGVETVSAGEHLVWRVLDARDLVRAALSWDPSLPASRLATAVPAALETGEPLARAAALMLERRTTHVVASGPGGEPAGVVSTLDVAAALAGTGA
jgi:CBS domain-containing protein